jgi:putative hydrolase of the HAD superfamily
MTRSRPLALLLDAMGTLITLRQSVGTTYSTLAAGHGIEVEARAIDRVFPAILHRAPPLAFNSLSGQELRHAELGWWAERIDTCLEAAGGTPAPKALHHELFEHFAEPAVWKVYGDVPDHLRAWRELGVRLAVVSNFDSRLHPLLTALGLSQWLSVVVVSSSAGAAKPSPRPFQLALEELGLCPDQAWHVGDSAEDAEGARAAGIRFLRIQRH